MIPRLLLTFANPAADDPGHLRGLPAERAAIAAALEDAVGYGLCAIDIDPTATRDGLIERLQDGDAMAHVVVFHYAGHASSSALAMDGAAGKGAAYAAGIAALLGQLPRLELVFLNGCSTQDQVDALLAAGVPAVIATAVDIIDAVATDFATHFYCQLGRGAPVQAAFAAAEAAVRTTHADPTARRNLGRSFLPQAALTSTRLPWTLHVARDDDAAWSLPDAADDPLFVLPRPAWPRPTRPYPGVAGSLVDCVIPTVAGCARGRCTPSSMRRSGISGAEAIICFSTIISLISGRSSPSPLSAPPVGSWTSP